MQQVNSGTAYINWCLCLFGICGGQRFYTGNAELGIVYLLTFGVFGIGQFVDLFLIPDMVENRQPKHESWQGDFCIYRLVEVFWVID